jgi:hypothetical protein
LKFRNEIEIETPFDSRMEEYANVAIELTCLASNIKKEFVEVLDFYFSL